MGKGQDLPFQVVFLLFLRTYPYGLVGRIVVVVCDREALVQFGTASSENRPVTSIAEIQRLLRVQQGDGRAVLIHAGHLQQFKGSMNL